MTYFYKTVFTVTVLSEGPLNPNMSLDDIHHATDTGDCVGSVSRGKPQRLSGAQMAEELIEAGSEPGFFQLDDKGRRVG